MATGQAATAPHILGLTGPIACGKSTVGDLLLELGAIERIDADQVVHRLMEPGTPTTGRIATEFGRGIVRPDGAIDRTRLARVVFADPASLRQLEAIVHPAVRHRVRARLDELQGQGGVVVVDAVRLLQSDLLPLCDAVWVVSCAPDVQLRRLLTNRAMTRQAAEGRIAAQPSFVHQRVSAVIENSGSTQALRASVRRHWIGLLRAWGIDHPPGRRAPDPGSQDQR